MNISLTPDLEKFVQEKVNSGLYTSVSEVIRESLRLLSTYDELHKKKLEQLDLAIDKGLEQLNKGQGVAANKAYQHLQQNIKSRKD